MRDEEVNDPLYVKHEPHRSKKHPKHRSQRQGLAKHEQACDRQRMSFYDRHKTLPGQGTISMYNTRQEPLNEKQGKPLHKKPGEALCGSRQEALYGSRQEVLYRELVYSGDIEEEPVYCSIASPRKVVSC